MLGCGRMSRLSVGSVGAPRIVPDNLKRDVIAHPAGGGVILKRCVSVSSPAITAPRFCLVGSGSRKMGQAPKSTIDNIATQAIAALSGSSFVMPRELHEASMSGWTNAMPHRSRSGRARGCRCSSKRRSRSCIRYLRSPIRSALGHCGRGFARTGMSHSSELPLPPMPASVAVLTCGSWHRWWRCSTAMQA